MVFVADYRLGFYQEGFYTKGVNHAHVTGTMLKLDPYGTSLGALCLAVETLLPLLPSIYICSAQSMSTLYGF